MPSSGPTKGAERLAGQATRWESHPGVATFLRIVIWVMPMAVALGFTWIAARLASPDKLEVNRWLWMAVVFALANLLLAGIRRVIHALTPLVALMKLTLVFPDQAPSRAKATLRRSSSRTMLRQLEDAQARGETAGDASHGDYLVQLLTEINEHDRLTRGHSERVRAYAEMLGEELGLGDDDMNKLRWSALLHDVGKLDVPYEILNKPGRPTDEEWKVLANHPAAAIRKLEPLRGWLGDWVHSADQHHCRWDGKGYPSDLAGSDIALSGRIVAVADAYDVMTSARSYKKPLPAEVARRELTDCAGSQFDPAMVRAFLNVSLGRLRTVAGPFGWLVNLIASAQVKIPIAATVGSGLTSAVALVAVSAGGLIVDGQPAELAMVDVVAPIGIVDSEAVGDEDQPIALVLTARGGQAPVSFRVGAAWHGEVAVDDGTLRRMNEPPSTSGAATTVSTWEQPVTYLPAQDFNGHDSFTVEVCHASDRCSSAVVGVVVRAVNDAPAANDDREITDAGQAVEIDALGNDVDVDGDELTIVGVEDPIDGQAILASNKIVYVPDPGFVGVDEIRYVITDPDGARAKGRILVTVTELRPELTPSAPVPIEPPFVDPAPIPALPPTTTAPPSTAPPTVNSPLVAVDDRAVTDEDTSVVVDVVANDDDADGDTLMVTGVGSPSHGLAMIENGRIRYQPAADYHGPDAVTYVLSDGVNAQVVADIDLTVNPVNDAPVLSGPSSVSISETAAIGSVVLTLAASDPDGDTLSYAITAGDPSDRFGVDGNGVVTVAAALDFETTSSYDLHLEATDGTVVTSHLASVTITDTNEVPVAGDDGGIGFTTTEDTLLATADVTANDGDVDDPIDPSTITVVAGPSNGTLVDNGDGTFDFDPAPEWSGTDSFTYTVGDTGSGISNPATVTIAVTPVNDAPNVANPGPLSVAEQMPFSIQIVATDVESDGLAYSAAGLPPGLSVDAAGLVSGAPGPGSQGSYSVAVNVTDDGTPPASTTVTFTLDVGYHLASAEAGNVVINEVLYNSVSAVAPEEFVELHNRSGSAIDVGGWILTDANLKADGAEDLTYPLPSTDHWGTASTLAPGGYAIVWLVHDGVNLPPVINPASGLEYVVNVAGTKLDNSGDDVWLLDPGTGIVDYMAYGTGAQVGTPPEVALNLWDATFQSSLLTGAAESVVVTPNGSSRDDSGCWEPTASGAANGRCTGAAQTFDSDSMGSLATSIGKSNNAAVADAGGPYAITEGAALTLDGSGSVGATSWNWDLDNDGQFDDATTVGPTVPWSAVSTLGIGDDGVYPIAVQVDGGADTDTATLTISNVAPTLATTGSGSVASGGLYTLNLAVTDPGDETISGWTINWGDGTVQTIVGNPSTVTHTYVGAGLTFNVLASATDEDGTVLQNQLLAPGYQSDEVYRYTATTGALAQNFATTNTPIETLIGPDGNLYVSGETSREVRRYNAATGAFVDQFVTTGSGGLNQSGGLAFGPDGNLYVADYGGDRVLRYDGSSGTFIDVFATTGLSGPYDLVFGPDLNLYVSEYDAHRVRRFDGTTGAPIDVFVTGGSGGLNTPEQITFGPDGNLYISSSGSGDVLRYNGTTGTFIDIFVAAAGAGDLDMPAGLAFGPDGNLFVTDLQDHVILRYDGSTGAFIDEYTVPGAGGVDEPAMMTFVPGHQVTVTP